MHNIDKEDYEDEYLPIVCTKELINISHVDPALVIAKLENYLKENNKNYKFMLNNIEHNLLSYFFENNASFEVISFLVEKNITLRHLNEKRMTRLANKIWSPEKIAKNEIENVELFLLLTRVKGFNEYDKGFLRTYPILLNYIYQQPEFANDQDFYFRLFLPVLCQEYFFAEYIETSKFVMRLAENDELYILDSYIQNESFILNIIKNYTKIMDTDSSLSLDVVERRLEKVLDYYFPEIDVENIETILNEFYTPPYERMFSKRRSISESEILLNRKIMDYIMRFDTINVSEIINDFFANHEEGNLQKDSIENIMFGYYTEVSTIKREKQTLKDKIKVEDNAKARTKERL